jgi:hypothetical protein
MQDDQSSTEPMQTKTNEAVEFQEQIVSETPKQKKPFIKKPVALAIFAAVLVVGGIVGAFVLTNDSEDEAVEEVAIEAPAQERITTLGAAVATIEGDVETSTDGATWTSAEAGQSLANLDYVRTLDSSRAIVLFDDGSVVRLDSNTELYLSSLEADALEVTLMDGQVYSRVVESENQTFTVATANERFQALGTAYKTSTDGTKDELEVYQSQVKVESADLDVEEGNKYDSDSKEKTALDLVELENDEFAQWNKEKDSESEEFKDKLGVLKDREEEPAPAPVPPSPTASISLTGTTSDKGVAGVFLTWELSGVSSTQGFKLVRSASDSTPTYGENEAIYVGDPSARNRTWPSEDGKTHYYRVCIYFEGTCSTYSNAVQVASPKVEKEPVVSGTINLSIDGQKLTWSLGGGTAPHGYKVVLSDSPNPVYPANSIQYIGSKTTSTTLPDKAAGTYYVKVCKYTNGTQEAGCVDYSNEVEYVVSS